MADQLSEGLLIPEGADQIDKTGVAAVRALGLTANAAIGERVRGTDPRLSDRRDPRPHKHALADVPELGAELDRLRDYADDAIHDGLSGIATAYDVWLSEGNEGSVQEYLDSLRGERGMEGPYGGTSVTDPQVAAMLRDDATETGALTRSLFARRSGTTTYWVHPEGSDSADGSEADPFATIGHAVRLAENLALDRASAVVIQLFPATYTEQVRFTRTTGFNLNVEIRGANVGGHPNVPTTVFDGEGGSSAAIYGANGSLVLTLRDLKFINYNTIAVAAVRADLFTINTHYEECAGGVRLTNGAIDVKGGIYRNVGYMADGSLGYAGITSFMANRHSIGQQHGTLADGPWFFGGYRGVQVQECATGHVDYCKFEDLEIAVTSNRASSVNPDGSSFKRNGIDLRAINTSSIMMGARVEFGTGADVSSQPMYCDATSIISTSMHWSGIASENGVADRLHSQVTTPQTYSTSSTTVLNTTLHPAFFNDLRTTTLAPAKSIRIRVSGDIVDSAGVKRLAFTLGPSAAFTDLRATLTGSFVVECEIVFRGRSSQLIQVTTLANGDPVRVRLFETSVDMSVDQLLRGFVQMRDGVGSLRVHDIQTWLRGI